MYDDRWLRFAHWAAGQGNDPLGPPAAEIAAFHIPSQSLQTIKGYRSCLASVLSRTGNAAAVQAKTIYDIIISVELQRPRMTPVLPRVGPSGTIVLEVLSKPPYDLLREASVIHLTLKIVFLLVMASARRPSELTSLSV